MAPITLRPPMAAFRRADVYHVILQKDGAVQQIEVVSGHPLLVQAAMDAVRQRCYQPALLNGEPVEVDTIVDVVFALNLPKPPSPSTP
ncbi:MAG TPA: energy transducer TonB [Candidatus Acidoferrum sp.]|nr:energy transducer TonB [Candidatus Acidoferrum sp.]